LNSSLGRTNDMPFTNTLPEPKIYSKDTHAFKTMRYYALVIRNEYFPDKTCYFCHSKEKLHIHHKNKDIWDNRLSNLLLVCAACHFKEDFPTGRPSWFKGKRHTERTKKILSDIAKKRTVGEEQRKKISAKLMGRIMTKEHKRKISEALKGKPKTQEHRNHLLKSWRCKNEIQEPSEGRSGINAPN
jgi:hypothetical protein